MSGEQGGRKIHHTRASINSMMEVDLSKALPDTFRSWSLQLAAVCVFTVCGTNYLFNTNYWHYVIFFARSIILFNFFSPDEDHEKKPNVKHFFLFATYFFSSSSLILWWRTFFFAKISFRVKKFSKSDRNAGSEHKMKEKEFFLCTLHHESTQKGERIGRRLSWVG